MSIVTQEFKDLLYLFSCACKSKEPNFESPLDVVKILEKAKEQSLIPLIFSPLKSLFAQGKLDIEPNVFVSLKNRVLNLVIENIRRSHEVHRIFRNLELNGIKYAVLKGEALSAIYPNGDYRISGDVDIYVDKTDIKKVCNIFKKCGYLVSSVRNSEYHVGAQHPNGWNVEIHFSLCEDLIDEIWFYGVEIIQEPFRTLTVSDGNTISTLGITDGVIFNFLHLIKHFLSKGAGIRQFYDVLIYVEYYKDEINWERFNMIMEQLGYNTFMSHVIGVGIEYLGFNSSSFPSVVYSKELLNKILIDVEMGGIFGIKANERAGHYLIYTQKRMGLNSEKKFNRFVRKRLKPSVFQSLFLNKHTMTEKYPLLKKYPFMLPFFYARRIICFILDWIFGTRSLRHYTSIQIPYESPEILERISLMKELDML